MHPFCVFHHVLGDTLTSSVYLKFCVLFGFPCKTAGIKVRRTINIKVGTAASDN